MSQSWYQHAWKISENCSLSLPLSCLNQRNCLWRTSALLVCSSYLQNYKVSMPSSVFEVAMWMYWDISCMLIVWSTGILVYGNLQLYIPSLADGHKIWLRGLSFGRKVFKISRKYIQWSTEKSLLFGHPVHWSKIYTPSKIFIVFILCPKTVF